jgi:hypothetical protein
MANRPPIPRIERRSRYSVLIDAEDGCVPLVVDWARQLTRAELRAYWGPGTWSKASDDQCYVSREEAEAAMIRERWEFKTVADVPVIDRRKTR